MIAVIVTFWPRFGVTSEILIEKAFISNGTDWIAVSSPSVTDTCEVYLPTGSIVPSSLRPVKVRL